MKVVFRKLNQFISVFCWSTINSYDYKSIVKKKPLNNGSIIGEQVHLHPEFGAQLLHSGKGTPKGVQSLSSVCPKLPLNHI